MAYECTRCDSFGTSGDPESQRCECDDVEDGLRADLASLRTRLAEVERERDECVDAIMSGPIAAKIITQHVAEYNERQADAIAALATERNTLRAQLKTALQDIDDWKRRWNEIQPTGPDIDVALCVGLAIAERDADLASLRARLAEVEAERDEARQHGANLQGVIEQHERYRARALNAESTLARVVESGERDYEAAIRQRDDARAICSKVNEAINRAGIHCAVYYWEAIDQIAADRDAAIAEVQRLRLTCRDLDAERDRLRQAVGIAEARAERSVVEAIAAWLDRRARSYSLVRPLLEQLAADIRAGAWRKETP